MHRLSPLRLPRLALLLALVVGVAALAGPAPTLATDPCGLVTGGPAAPPEEPEPTIAGVVRDAPSSEPVAGATMRLYRCIDGSGVLADTATTSAAGGYGFDQLTQAHYFVQADLSGPLAGAQPAAGTANPSAPIEVGAGDPDLDFWFE